MTMATRKIAAFTKLISALADRPALGSTTILKQWFDSSPEELRVALNGLIDDLIATTAGSSGAENIGSAPIAGVAGGVASTPYAQIADIKAQLTAIILGQIPDGTVTSTKLAPNSITYANADAATQTNLIGGQIYAYKNMGGF